MQVRVLGPIEVSGENGPVSLGGPKQRSVLAHLIVRANHVVPTDTLIDQVWGEEPPAAARTSLQAYVSNLRRALGAERLEGRAPGYVLHLEPAELDASRFEALVQDARGADGDAGRVAMILGEALALWRGPAYADLSTEASLSGEIARLEELRLQALEERLAADLAAGRHGEVIGELESLTRDHALRERLWGGLMLALYRSGRQADALATYQRARGILGDELGVDPSPELQRLHERILRQDPDLDVQGEALRGYRLLERIGEGAFGVVNRAIQPHVGREVAVKVIHAELANQPDFVRRFEREAQMVARLEHPHVVPLHDYWREPDGAYLVMRYLRGGTLEDALADGGLDLDRVAALLDQVTGALGAAHRQGIVHRDIKPGNVLLDEEGNAYLSDFGVALSVGATEQTTGTMIRGTPAYLSPEQIRLEPLTTRSDIYALGILLFEMLTGRHPFPDSPLNVLLDQLLHQPLPSARGLRPELAPAVDAVIARATAKRPDQRFAEASDVAAAFRTAVERNAPVAVPGAEVRNPYKGLRAFLEADAADFFGRESLVRRLAERLAEPGPRSRFLCVVGPSGSGKSSVVRAGLVPALRRGAIEGSDQWFVVDLLPGPNPLRELESALLGVAIQPPPSLSEELERDELGLLRAVDRALPDPDAELLIVLDQMEEMFTLVDAAERRHLLGSIRAAVESPGSRVRVVATLRADFFDQPLSVSGFGDLLAERTEAITLMSPEQLERAIAGPAEHVGLMVEPGLVAAMVADVADRPSALPLLEFALTELAERPEGDLTLDAYRGIGGVSGALARRAERIYGAMNDAGRSASRQLFLSLVTLGEGTEDTRRRVRRTELHGLDVDRAPMDAAIDTFGRYRLLSFDRDELTREPTVELAHEALIHAWTRLGDWIDEAREDVRTHRRLVTSANEWAASGEEPSFLLTGARLERLASWVSETPLALGRTELAFVERSLAVHAEEARSERARVAHERSLERRSVRRLRGFVAVLAVASLVAATLTVVAVNRSAEAELERDRSRVSGLTGAALANLRSDPELSVLLTLHAVNLSASIGDPVPSSTVEALHWAMQEAGIGYPARDGPTAVVAGPLGTRGLLDLPLSTLVNHARSRVTRGLTRTECNRYFGATSCPPMPSEAPAGLEARPVHAVVPMPPGQPLAGTEVTLLWQELQFNSERLLGPALRELDRFSSETGIEVRLVDLPEVRTWFTSSDTPVDPPDLLFTNPGAMVDLVANRHLVDMGAFLDAGQLRADQSPYLVRLGTVGPDGSWPSADGGLYGAFVSLDVKSLIWYPVPELRAAGYAIPTTTDELATLAERLHEDGRTPWCLGLQAGDASGWPATDWIENLLLAEAGTETYDRWTFHELPFDSEPVRRAFERFGDVVFTNGSLPEGPEGALRTWFGYAQRPMVADPPGCWLYLMPSFAEQFLPRGAAGTQTDVFPFPSDSPGFPELIGGGGMVSAFADRPEVREVLRFLLGPEFGAEMTRRGAGFMIANRRFDLSNYLPFERRQAELLHAALEADGFRFDASDLMPPEIGSDRFWQAMLTYLEEGPESLDRILAELDTAWPGDS
jgi:DNA-binding SARP family transcriptional activator/ABC-type glycerol-3-phosphate transport system substrate-binding protein